MDIPPPTRRFTLFALTGLACACAAALFLAWLTEEVLEGDTSHFDAYARAAVHSAASPKFTAGMWFFTDLGSVLVLSSLLIAVVGIFWFCAWRRAAFMLLITMAGSALLVETLKIGFHRARPSPYFGIVAPHSFSYPSGHALFSFSFFATVAALATARIRSLWARALIWLVAAAVIGLIGFSRVYLGVHYATDVIAGYLTGFIWVMVVSFGDRHFRRLNRPT